MKSVLQLAFVGTLLGLQPSAQAGSILALDIVTGNGVYTANVAQTEGWTFTVNSPVQVDGLGFWDEGSNGLTTGHAIGIWSGTGTLLASASINNAGTVVPSTSSLGRWMFSAVTPVELTPGSYTIGASYGNSDADWARTMASISLMPGITFGNAVVGGFGNGLQQPSISMSALNAGMLGPTFSATPIPEPTTFGLMGVALCLMMIRSRGPLATSTASRR